MKQAAKDITGLPAALRDVAKAGHVMVPKRFSGPGAFSMSGEGDCMEPLISNGDTFVCDAGRTPEQFDLVAIAFKSGNWWVKRFRYAADDFKKEYQ